MSESTRPIRPLWDDPGDRWAHAMAAHEGLVHWVVRQQHRGPLSYADAVHEGRIGLWQALRGYDPARGTRFSTYAVPAITHALWKAVAAARARPAAAAPALALLASGANPAEQLPAQQEYAALHALVATLPPGPRHIVVAHLGLAGAPPRTFAALGQELGVSRQRVHQRYVAALEHLAHPARSLPLRRLRDRATRTAYQQTLARQRRRSRVRRRGRARRP